MSAGSGEIPHVVIFRDFIVHGAVPQNLKPEKGSKKGTSTGVRTAHYTVASGVKRPGLSFFSDSVLSRQNLAEILFVVCFAFRRSRLQKHNWKSIPLGIAKKL